MKSKHLKQYSHAIWNKKLFSILLKYCDPKSADKEEINIIMICLQTTIDYCGIAHPGHNSKSGLRSRLYFTSGTLFLLFIMSNHCKKN